MIFYVPARIIQNTNFSLDIDKKKKKLLCLKMKVFLTYLT